MASALFAVAVVALYLVTLYRPGAACGFVLSSFILEQCAQAFVPLAGRNDSLCNYLVAGTVLVGLGARATRRGGFGGIRLGASAFGVLTLIGYCYVSFVWSLFPSTTLAVLNVVLPYLVVLVGLAPLLVGGPQDFRDALTALVGTTLFSLATLLVFAEWGRRGVVLPFSDGESNPLLVAQAAGSLLIVGVFGPQMKHLKRSVRIAILSSIVVVVLVSFLRSGSRGQILAAAATIAVFASVGRGRLWIPVAVLALVMLFGSGFLEEEVARNAGRWDASKVQGDLIDERFGRADRLLTFWSRSSPDHLFLGLGHAVSQDPRVLGSYPHVVPVEVLAEEGIVGALLYALVMLIAARELFRAYAQGTREHRDLATCSAALLVYEFLLSLKQGSLLTGASFLMLLALPGVLATQASHAPFTEGD